MAETAAIAPPPQPMAESATAAPPQPMAGNATTAAVVVVVPPPSPPDNTMTFLCLLIAIFLPPLGVFIKYNCEVEFWICLVLTFFGYFPGVIYAIWVIVKP
ncbi:hydrophobic protein LTI6A [Hordeum vulgare]|uniref:Predicted protein n=1 Tax=Hordeum vulgare subsp. vulgare TaxID=112509 RepID=F2EIW6_HORVV|nr:hydrophobic protein RCI2B-like [Hordeum vulgare subsp. vulgare]KAE8790265.1 hydrophobic protein LTI6A [Hordeum vulgare]KAI5009575.1 hypothetical protein ZWY2020_011712 [Hordeum vulgare]BAK07288.1 predicted protein [Hordeum vulgare subsp. vulgare]